MHPYAPVYARIAEHLDHAHHILLLNPEKGDGDSLGSTLALAHHLARRQKRYGVFSRNLAPKIFSYLPRFEEIEHREEQLDLHQYDLIVTVDFADPKMTGIEPRLLQVDRLRCPIINIDHHPTNFHFGDVNLVDPNSAAAAEIIYGLFEQQGWPIDAHVATCLLTGILTDTSSFANRNTTFRSLEIAGLLLSAGARLQTIMEYTLRNKSLGVLRLWGKALARLQHNTATGLVTTFITEQDLAECGVTDEATEGIANFLNALEGAKAVLVLREVTGGRVKGSFRTTGDDVDVAELAARFGGGGHRRAAGFTIHGRLQEVEGVWRVV